MAPRIRTEHARAPTPPLPDMTLAGPATCPRSQQADENDRRRLKETAIPSRGSDTAPPETPACVGVGLRRAVAGGELVLGPARHIRLACAGGLEPRGRTGMSAPSPTARHRRLEGTRRRYQRRADGSSCHNALFWSPPRTGQPFRRRLQQRLKEECSPRRPRRKSDISGSNGYPIACRRQRRRLRTRLASQRRKSLPLPKTASAVLAPRRCRNGRL